MIFTAPSSLDTFFSVFKKLVKKVRIPFILLVQMYSTVVMYSVLYFTILMLVKSYCVCFINCHT